MAVSEHVCGRCGHEFCPECVVFPFGTKKPPMCISCALEAGGVSRQHTGRPRLSTREVRNRLSEHRRSADDVPRPAPAPPQEDQTPAEDPWLSGEQSAEDAGGWSRRF